MSSIISNIALIATMITSAINAINPNQNHLNSLPGNVIGNNNAPQPAVTPANVAATVRTVTFVLDDPTGPATTFGQNQVGQNDNDDELAIRRTNAEPFFHLRNNQN